MFGADEEVCAEFHRYLCGTNPLLAVWFRSWLPTPADG